MTGAVIAEFRSAAAHACLADIARALNDLRDIGVPAQLRHGAIMTDCGFVLPDGDGEWTARLKVYDPHMQPVGDPDDD